MCSAFPVYYRQVPLFHLLVSLVPDIIYFRTQNYILKYS